MSIDTPATIAVLGAGPIGLEAALYARFLGYDVNVYEQDVVAGNVLQWGHVRMFSPFGMNRSTLGIAAIAAQDPSWQAPGDQELLTGAAFAQRYLIPLSQTDLLVDHLHTQMTVVSVGRDSVSKMVPIGDQRQSEGPFQLLVRDADGQESYAGADVVIDATGVYSNHRWLGPGGIPAVGEQSFAAQMVYGVPDVLGRDRASYAGAHTLVVGAGYSAATTVVGLGRLATETEGTRVTWVTRQSDPADTGPIGRIADDRLAARDEVAVAANRLALTEDGPVTYLPAMQVRQVGLNAAGGVDVELCGDPDGTVQVDRIVANVGYRPDSTIHGELQVQQCHASEALMKIAANLLAEASNDCLEQATPDAAQLVTSEPNFYIIGNKSYGRDPRFLIGTGLKQIRDLFAIIGDREDLDLYRGVQNLALGTTER